MDLSHLSSDQRHKLLMAVCDRRDYFEKLRDRMKARGWPADDPLFVAVCKARDAAQEVVMKIYQRPEKPPELPGWVTRMGPS